MTGWLSNSVATGNCRQQAYGNNAWETNKGAQTEPFWRVRKSVVEVEDLMAYSKTEASQVE